MKATLIIDKIDETRGVVLRRELPSRSFLFNFIKILYAMAAEETYSVTDVDDVARNVQGNLSVYWCPNLVVAGAPGDSCQIYHAGRTLSSVNILDSMVEGLMVGIVVGTGANPVTLDDISLQTRVNHGRGAGQLEYGGCGVPFTPVLTHPDGEFTIQRYFTNNSGGTITITEAGIHALAVAGTVISPYLIARDLVAPGLEVDNGEILRVGYVLQTTV